MITRISRQIGGLAAALALAAAAAGCGEAHAGAPRPAAPPSGVLPRIEALANGTGAARLEAAAELGRLDPADRCALRALTEALEDDDPAVRRAAARSLGEMGPAAHDALPALSRRLRDPAVCVDIQEAIHRIEPPAPQAPRSGKRTCCPSRASLASMQ